MRIGIDLGGTKIEGIALDDGGTTLFRERRPTPRHDYAHTVRAVTQLVLDIERAIGQRGTVGIATPGAIAPATGRLKNSNSVWLNGQRIDVDLARALSRPVRIANDADCFALSEATDGAAAGASTVFGVILGTGTGGGIVIGEQIVGGPNRIAGEWGHNPLPWPQPEELPGPPCYCGQRGCIETFLSGPGLSRAYAADGGPPLSAAEICVRARDGEPVAKACLQRYLDRLCRALASVINVLDPYVIVLGGGLSNIDRVYREVPRRWNRYVFSDRVATRLVKAHHGDSSGVRGAARLWNRRAVRACNVAEGPSPPTPSG